MLKYHDYAVVFQEVPDEITLAIDITNCPHRCAECHSPWLREDKGIILDGSKILNLYKQFPYISCICLMGGDANHEGIKDIANFIHQNTKLKVAMYSGDDIIDQDLIPTLDYYKIGSYQKDLGPLSSETTNQRFYQVSDNKLIDITYKFINTVK